MKQYAIVGTYTKIGSSKGIYLLKRTSEGQWSICGHSQNEVANPTYVTTFDQFIYTVVTNDDGSGGIATYQWEDEKLTFIDQLCYPDAGGCHITIDRSGRYIITSHYHHGKLEVHAVDKGKIIQRNQQIMYQSNALVPSFIHCAAFTPDQRCVIVCDLGKDQIYLYPFNHQTGLIEQAAIQTYAVAPGSGPRHILFVNDHDCYILNERSGTINYFYYVNGTFTHRKDQPLQEQNVAAAAIKFDGTYLYTSQRQQPVLSQWQRDSNASFVLLDQIPLTAYRPRDFCVAIQTDEMMIAFQDDSVIHVYEQQKDGKLGILKQVLPIPHPVYIELHHFAK